MGNLAYYDTAVVSKTFSHVRNAVAVKQNVSAASKISYQPFKPKYKAKSHTELMKFYRGNALSTMTRKPMLRRKKVMVTPYGNLSYISVIV